MIQRGQIVVVSLAGDYGKPRPAIVIQATSLSELPSVVLCPITSMLREDAKEFRLAIEPTGANGLTRSSQIMIDRISAVPRSRISQIVGMADPAIVDAVSASLAVLLGLASGRR